MNAAPDVYNGKFSATYKGVPVTCSINNFGLIRVESITGRALWWERRHTHRAKMFVIYTNRFDPSLAPDDCACRPDGDACPACRDWHNIQEQEMPF